MTAKPPPLEPGEIELDRRLLIAGVLTIALIIAGVMSFGSRPAGTIVEPTPSASVTTTPPPATVAAIGPTSVACPSGWRGFVNPVHDYELCRPASWRIVQQGTVRGQLLASALRDIRLVDARALPWAPGADPLQVVAGAGSIDIQLIADATPDVISRRCEPTTARGAFTRCSFTASATGRPKADGPLRVVLASLTPGFSGDRVIIALVTTRSDAPPRTLRLADRVLDTLRRVPDAAML